MGVEAKVDETFGPLVSEWNDSSPGKTERLKGLVHRLGLTSDLSGLRYQLLHRTAAALIEAEAAGVGFAILVVQSFSPNETRAGFSDFREFARRMGAPVEAPDRLSAPIDQGGIRLWLGWAQDRLYGS